MTEKETIKNFLGLGAEQEAPNFIIYTDEKTARLQYTCEFIFTHVLKVNYHITSDHEVFESSPLFKINYSLKWSQNNFQVLPAGLMAEKKLSFSEPPHLIENDKIYFFPSAGDLSFDIFSAVFYFISRMEEWGDFERDEHGRFELKASILFKKGFHLKPVVDVWIDEMKRCLEKKYELLRFPESRFTQLATIDVDNLYAYKHKSFFRTVGAAIKDMLRLDLGNVMRRNRVINGVEEDPFDIYESFSSFCAQKNIPVVFFFLFRSGTKYDRTVSTDSGAFQKIFDILKRNRALIGLHPSYYTKDDAMQLGKEMAKFSLKLGKPVDLSRQHYLRFDIKNTPAHLMKHGIKADFTIGFASGAGFRAGTTHPFYYYDFEKENKTDLLFVPFCAMDGAYFVYGQQKPEQAFQQLLQIKREIKQVNGRFITVFHERSFAEHLYPGFGAMYKKLLESV